MQEGHVVAAYNLAMLQLGAGGRMESDCRAALKNLIKVALRGPEGRHVPIAYSYYQTGDYARSLVHYLFAAEMGIEVAMSNAAWILDRGCDTVFLFIADVSVRAACKSFIFIMKE